MPPAFFTYPFASSSAAAGGGEGAGAAPGEGSAGFVMLEGTEAIGAEMLRQAQEEAEQAAGGGPQQGEYELAQLGASSARRAADVCDGDEGEDQEGDEEEEEEEDTLSLSGLPKDLRGICRRLRGEPPSDDDDEEDVQEAETEEQDGSPSRPASPLVATPRSKKTKRRSKSAAAAAAGAGTGAQAPSFLCWAWPLSAREALFWLVALAFLASLALITLGGAGGRYRRHYSAMGRTRAGLARRACPAAAAPPTTADYYYEEEERAAGGGGTPLFLTAQEARRLAARMQAGETEAAGLRAVLRDREEELAWMRSAQYGLETQVQCLQKQLAGARKEADTLRAAAAAAAAAHRTTAAAANEAPTGPSSRCSAPSNSNNGPRVVQVIPEARVVKAQPSLLHGGHWFLFGGAPSAGNGNATTAFHPPLWFHWSARRGKGLQREEGKQEAAAAAAVKAASFVPPAQSAPRSYAETGMEEKGSGMEVEAEEEEEEEWTDDEEWSEEEDWSEEEEEEDSEWEESDEEWSDEEDDEWWSDEDEEEECWCGEEAEAEQEKASFPAYPWPHERRRAAIDVGKGKGKQRTAPPLVLPQDFADACAAPPASPLLQ